MARFHILPLLAVLACMLACAQATLHIAKPSIECAGGSSTSLKVKVTAGTLVVGGVSYGAPAGFRVEFVTLAQYQASGFTNKCQKTFSNVLAAGQSITVTLNPCGSTPVLTCGTTYVIRVVARPFVINGVQYQQSYYSAPIQCATGACKCTFTQGYWKNRGAALGWPVQSVKLGTVTYSKSQCLQIFNTAVTGNGLIALSHQLIAAKLNVYYGANPTQVLTYIAQADALIGSLVCPPIGSGYLDTSKTSYLTGVLDTFNNGGLGAPHC